ncbi:MAG: glycosyltransferase family 4 protein [Methylovirgula sp.]|nr:glycosyltransferase family 4 protein [Methylovirgula sp.]
MTWQSQSAAVWPQPGQHPLAGQTILQIVPVLGADGTEQIIDIVAALASIGARPLVASAGGRLVPELQAKGGLWLPFPAQTKNPLAMVLNQRKLAELLWRERVALVHARSRTPAWVAYGATRRPRVAFVTTYHGAYSGSGAFKFNYNAVMAKGDIIIANSVFTAQHIASLYPAAAGRIRIVARGIDFRVFAPQDVDPGRVLALRNAWDIASDERIVLLPARLAARKGHKVLIEAARLLTAAGLRGVKFILAGDEQGQGAYVRELDATIAKAGLEAIVRRTGRCPDMPAALLAATVAVVPAMEPETFSRVTAEAQAMGTPVVVSDLGGLAEVVAAPPEVEIAERTGWRVPPGDARALAAAVYDVLMSGASAREAMSLRARARVLGRYSVARMQAETLAAYTELIGR